MNYKYLLKKSILPYVTIAISILPLAANSGVRVEKTYNEYVTINEQVEWKCVEDLFPTHNYCYIDTDSIFQSNYGWQIFYNSVNTKWQTSGVYRVSTGTRYCSITETNCSSPSSYSTDTIIVAPTGGWNLNSYAEQYSGNVGATFRYHASAQQGENCCTYQWQFGDGSSVEDYQTNGNSSVTKIYNSPGNYTVKVWLESPTNDEDFVNSQGNRVEQSLNIRVDPIPSPPPSPVSNFRAKLHKTQMAYYSLNQNDQQGVLWTNHHTDEDNSFPIQWNKPSNASTRIEYRVDFGTVGKNGALEDIGWTLYKKYNTSQSSGSLVALPPQLLELYYDNKLRVPDETFDPTSDDYIMIYYRLRAYNSNGSSDWGYLGGIWYYYRD